MIDQLATHLGLGALLQAISESVGRYEILDHWTQGEFHHDLILRVPSNKQLLLGSVLVIATDCNGGVKELLCFDEVPEHAALWHQRCPDNTEFAGLLPPLLDSRRTVHWFNPCTLLVPDAFSEYKPEFRERQLGGGWQPKRCGNDVKFLAVNAKWIRLRKAWVTAPSCLDALKSA